jgi:putative membrane protein
MRKRVKGKFSALTALAVLLSAPVLAASAQADTWGGGWHDGWGWGHMFFGSIMMLLFWGGVIVLIVLAVRWMGSGPTRAGDAAAPENRALDILEERFARGEIDKEEFEERRRLLSK